MTVKQMLLSVFMLGATANTILAIKNPYKYPENPFGSCNNWCDFDIEQYEQKCQNAINRELNSRINENDRDAIKRALRTRILNEEDFNNGTWVGYIQKNHEKSLAFRMRLIKESQRTCLEHKFANLVCHLNHEQQ